MKTTEPSLVVREEGSHLPSRRLDGFTFVEILVAAAISAVTIAVAALAFSAIVQRSPSVGEIDVSLPSGVANTFYGMTNDVVSVSAAPSFGELGRAEAMREILEDDLRCSVATVCLARNGVNPYRPTNIAVSFTFDPRTTLRPADFKTFLQGNGSAFVNYQGPATNADSVTMFVFQPSANAASLNIRAIYESDIIPTSSPVGIYGSVRRYAGGVLTDFYHVFYEGKRDNSVSPPVYYYDGQTNTSFAPPVVYFDRTISTDTTNAPTAFRQAPGVPFYFLWWPDPLRFNPLHTNSFIQPASSSQPRSGYWRMAYRTSYFFVIPALPAL